MIGFLGMVIPLEKSLESSWNYGLWWATMTPPTNASRIFSKASERPMQSIAQQGQISWCPMTPLGSGVFILSCTCRSWLVGVHPTISLNMKGCKLEPYNPVHVPAEFFSNQTTKRERWQENCSTNTLMSNPTWCKPGKMAEKCSLSLYIQTPAKNYFGPPKAYPKHLLQES